MHNGDMSNRPTSFNDHATKVLWSTTNRGTVAERHYYRWDAWYDGTSHATRKAAAAHSVALDSQAFLDRLNR